MKKIVYWFVLILIAAFYDITCISVTMDGKVNSELSFLFGKHSAWIGENPPIKADIITLAPEKNFRLSPKLHGAYEVVWLYEHNLLANPNWPLIFDEVLRLINAKGTLIMRVKNTQNSNLVELKSYLFRRYDIKVDLVTQFKLDDRSTVLVFDVKRLFYNNIQRQDWTIGIITNGYKNQNVINLINKAAKLAKGLKLEFIVVGPFDPNATNVPKLVRTFDVKTKDNLARISEKKYLIARHAKYDNVAIFHDRYQINDDFFEGFKQFGYDFNFVTVKQMYEDGSFFPGYVGLAKPIMHGFMPQFDTFPGTFHPGHFISGGLMIFKKSALEKFTFNPLLLHCESEDVELSFMFLQSGIIPRLNVFSSATTNASPNKYARALLNVSNVRKQSSMLVKASDLLFNIWEKLPDQWQENLRASWMYRQYKRIWFS